jgi:DNA primase
VPSNGIQLFRLGYAPADWDHTIRWANQLGLDLSMMEKAGLIARKEGTDRYYGRFRDRLMFPICDEQGRVVAFSGRVLKPDAPGGKYVNSPETPIFSKGRIFFGLDKSKRAILDSQFAVVCEGQLDLIRCHLAGIQNTVAPQGTALTADHARILKRYANEVVLCFDADNAGQNAADRSLDNLLAAGLAVRVAVMPSPHDPDSFIRQEGADAFNELIRRAPGFFDYYLDRCCRLHDPATDKGRLAISRSMAEAVWKTGHEVLVDTYAQKTAHRLGISPDAVRREFRQLASAKRPAFEDSVEPAPAESATEQPSPHEFWLLRLLLLDDDLASWVARYLVLDWISHPAVRRLIARRLEASHHDQWTGVATFMSQLTDPTEAQLVSSAVAENRDIPNRPQQAADLVRRLRNLHLDSQLGDLQRQLADPAVPDADKLSLIRSLNSLRQAKSQPLEAIDPTHL